MAKNVKVINSTITYFKVNHMKILVLLLPNLEVPNYVGMI